MKKLLFFAASLIFLSVQSVFASDLKFIQMDSLMLSSDNPSSIKTLQNLVKTVNKQKNVDFVIFSGNNIAKPSKENLKIFVKEANKLKTPYYIAIGNKEVNKQKHFGKKEYLEYLNKHTKGHKKAISFNNLFIKDDNVFIIMDGAREVIYSSAGYYNTEALDWLDVQLGIYQNKNVVIFQHFPIIPPAKKESRYTHKADEYLNIINKYNNVKAIFAGNFGVNKEEYVRNTLHVSTPDAPFYREVDIVDCDTKTPTYWSVIKD